MKGIISHLLWIYRSLSKFARDNIKSTSSRLDRAAALATRVNSSLPYRGKAPRFRVSISHALAALIGRGESSSPGRFEALTPTNLDSNEMSRYEAELMRAFRSPAIRNVAITGGFGAGKSSLIQSFAALHPEYKYTFISLATFDSSTEVSVASESTGERALIERVEATIVQQLLYSVDSSVVPDTRLKRISQTSKLRLALLTVGAFSAACSVIRLIGPPKEAVRAVEASYILGVLNAIPVDVAIATLVALATWLSIGVITSLSSLRPRELVFKGVRLETPNVASVLHKHVDEIVYLFSRNKIDIVIIEDLDRFERTEFFVRLREINMIVNSSPEVGRPVYFVYVVRDDLFKSGDRVKFFDLIIPVIPVVNSENSREVLSRSLSKSPESFNNLNSVLVETISYFVDDMRAIINISNEYDLHWDMMRRSIDLDANKLFASVVMKCLYPNEYAKLLKSRGDIWDILKSYRSYGREVGSSIRAKIDDLERQISRNADDVAKSSRDLRAILWLLASDFVRPRRLNSIAIGGHSWQSYEEMVDDENLLSRLKGPTNVDAVMIEGGSVAIDYSKLMASGSPSFAVRLEALHGRDEQMRAELSRAKAHLKSTEWNTLSEAIGDAAFVAEVSSTVDRKGLGPLSFLISQGYFGEDYFDYVGRFYEGTLSARDKNTLIAIRSGALVDVACVVDNPGEIVNRLSPHDVRAGRGLLVSLVSSAFKGEASWYIDAALTVEEDHADRVGQLFSLVEYEQLPALVGVALASAPSLIGFAIARWSANSDELDIVRFVAVIMQSPLASSIDESLRLTLRNTIGGLSDVNLFADGIYDEKVALEWARMLGAKFNHVASDTSKDVLKLLSRIDMLAMTTSNISIVFAAWGWSADRRPSLKWVYDNLDEDVLTTIGESSSDFLSALVESVPEGPEDWSSVLRLASGLDEDIGALEKIVDKLEFVADPVEMLPSSLWLHAWTGGRVLVSWNNVATIIASLADEDAVSFVKGLFEERPKFGAAIAGLVGRDNSETAVSELASRIVRLDQSQPIADFVWVAGAVRSCVDNSIEVSKSWQSALLNSEYARWSKEFYYLLQDNELVGAIGYLSKFISFAMMEGGLEISGEAIGLILASGTISVNQKLALAIKHGRLTELSTSVSANALLQAIVDADALSAVNMVDISRVAGVLDAVSLADSVPTVTSFIRVVAKRMSGQDALNVIGFVRVGDFAALSRAKAGYFSVSQGVMNSEIMRLLVESDAVTRVDFKRRVIRAAFKR